MTDPRPLLVTSALPYANGPIHFGQVIGAYLPADVYVRTLRRLGDERVLWLRRRLDHRPWRQRRRRFVFR